MTRKTKYFRFAGRILAVTNDTVGLTVGQRGVVGEDMRERPRQLGFAALPKRLRPAAAELLEAE